MLARVALRQQHAALALESYQRAVYEYWPANELDKRRQARWEMIDLLQSVGHHRDQLVGELLQLYGNLPPHSDQRMRVAAYLLNAGADAEAAHVFRDVLKDVPSESQPRASKDLTGAQTGLATVAFRAGDFIEARHEYQRALRAAPDDLSTAARLQFTNDIIDIAPQLPNISAAERLRRSRNLLNKVEADLQNCTANPGAETNLQSRLAEIASQKSAAKEDEGALLQQSAQELWKDRSTYCGNTHISDPALEAVLPRLGQQQQ